MSQSSNILSDIIATTSRFSTSAEVLRRWQAVLSEAEIAARPIPHDNSEETEILSYVQRWGAAMVSHQCNSRIPSQADPQAESNSSAHIRFQAQRLPNPCHSGQIGWSIQGRRGILQSPPTRGHRRQQCRDCATLKNAAHCARG